MVRTMETLICIGSTMRRPSRITMPYGSSRATGAAIALGRTPTKMRPPSRGGSGMRLNTANTTLMPVLTRHAASTHEQKRSTNLAMGMRVACF
jgi:hypothetical protein